MYVTDGTETTEPTEESDEMNSDYEDNWLRFNENDWYCIAVCDIQCMYRGWRWRTCELLTWKYNALKSIESPDLDICVRMSEDEYEGLPPHTFFLDRSTLTLYDDLHIQQPMRNICFIN